MYSQIQPFWFRIRRGKFSTNLSPSGRIRQVQNTTSCHNSGTMNSDSIRICTVRGHAPYKYPPAILCQRAQVQIQTRSESPGATLPFPYGSHILQLCILIFNNSESEAWTQICWKWWFSGIVAIPRLHGITAMIYICIYIYVYMYIYVHVYVYIYVHIYMYMYVYMYMYMYMYMYIHMYIYMYVHVYMYLYHNNESQTLERPTHT